MDFGTIFRLLPHILTAVQIAKEVQNAADKGTMVDVIKSQGPKVFDFIKKVGAELFPDLPRTDQVVAGALILEPETVKRIQTQLNSLGAELDVDGSYGKKTKAAVKRFQEANELDADGWAGPDTQRVLNEKAPL